MNIDLLSTKYKVRKLTKEDITDIFNLCSGNPMYYNYCPPAISIDGVIADMEGLPPGKTYKDKYYIGFYQNKKLVAIMDLIYKYPDDETAYIGFFMMSKDMQGKGIATAIISECCEYLKTIKFKKIKLGYAKGNRQSEAFWIKNLFTKTGVEVQLQDYIAIPMEKVLL